MGIIKAVKLWILTVNRKCVLCQVICANGEEINLLCQKIRDHDCCRCLDHNSQFTVLKWDSLCGQFCFHLRNDLFDTFHLFHRNDHREHNGDRSVIACTVNCTELRLENFRSVKADSDCTVSHCRIFFFLHMEIVHLLIGSNI